MNRYKISVIVAVYNVQEYIDEAMQSIINQTMGFDNIQVIMVDDCSVDDSAEVCKKYAELYPNNVIFVQKEENSGAADTRNVAMQYIQGEVTTSIDPDDYVDLDMFERVYKYYSEVKDEVDVVAVALRFFEAQKGYHICSKYNFDSTRIVDIDKEWYSIQGAVCGAFIRSDVFKKYKYPKNLVVDSEDTFLITQIILEKRKYAVLSNCNYNYRKRDNKNSLTQTNGTKKEWYINKIKDFQLTLIEQCIEKYGSVPKYIQFLCMYITQWNIKYNCGLVNVLDEEETKVYIDLLHKMLLNIDDDIIVNQKGDKKLGINIHMANFLLKVKYGEDKCNYVYKQDYIGKTIGNNFLYSIYEHGINISTVEIKNGYLKLSGYMTNPFEGAGFELKLYAGDEEIEFIKYQSDTFQPKYFGIKASECVEFFCTIPLELYQGKLIYFNVENSFTKYKLAMIFKKFPFSKMYPANKCSYYVNEGFRLYQAGKNLVFRKVDSKVHRKLECKLLKEFILGKKLLRKKSTNVKAFLLRVLYWLTYPVYHGNWLFMDRADKGGDNAEFLFRYSVKQQDGMNKYFIVNKNTATYKKMKKDKLPVVGRSSIKHRLLFLHCAKFITSQMDVIYMNDMRGIEVFFRDLFNFDYIHIQHGISWQKLDHLLNANIENLKLITSCSNIELENLKQERYGYVNKQLRTGGMARFDGFAEREKEKKQILICPTWRKELVGKLLPDGTREYSNTFRKSQFYQLYNGLLADREFIDKIENYGYRIMFVLHPNLQAQREDFCIDPRVNFPEKKEIDYDCFLKESGIMVTDYSGIQFDFAYMKKPIIYLHHKDLPNHLQESEFFNYQNDAFGDICADVEEVKEKVYETIENNGLMKKEYIARVDKFFIYDDYNNCQRIYQEILKEFNQEEVSA